AVATLSPRDSPSALRHASFTSVFASRAVSLMSLMSLIGSLLSSLNRGGRRGYLEPSHRRLLDAYWQLADELQRDSSNEAPTFEEEVPTHDQRNQRHPIRYQPLARSERRRSVRQRGGGPGRTARGAQRDPGRWTLHA